MGYMRHHAIVVTAYSDDWGSKARAHAVTVFGEELVSGLLRSPCNGYQSFLVAPDGSNEGWSDSDDGDHKRELFIAWLASTRYEDGSSPLNWVEVQYGDDDLETRIVRDSDEETRRRRKSEQP